MVILRRALVPLGGIEALRNGVVPFEELNRQVVSAAARTLVCEQELAVLQVGELAAIHDASAGLVSLPRPSPRAAQVLWVHTFARL